MAKIVDGISIKTSKELDKMSRGGKKLARVKSQIKKSIKEGFSAYDVEKKTNEIIRKEGAKASFKMVPGYSWATCVNINSGLVHGIPKKNLIFKKGDVVSVDMGIFYNGFHTDTSFTVAIEPNEDIKRFLKAGREALRASIKQAKPGNRVYDISKKMEAVISSNGYTPIKALVGHGIGPELHEEPQVPCIAEGQRWESPEIIPGMALAIEVMYAQGSDEVVKFDDGWTIGTRDGKIAALFEDTVIITKNGPKVITELSSVKK